MEPLALVSAGSGSSGVQLACAPSRHVLGTCLLPGACADCPSDACGACMHGLSLVCSRAAQFGGGIHSGDAAPGGEEDGGVDATRHLQCQAHMGSLVRAHRCSSSPDVRGAPRRSSPPIHGRQTVEGGVGRV